MRMRMRRVPEEFTSVEGGNIVGKAADSRVTESMPEEGIS